MYAEINNGALVKYPYDFAALQADNPYTSFPPGEDVAVLFRGTTANLAGNTLVTVTSQSEPTYDPATQTISLASQPTLVDGQWVLVWTVSQMTPEELAAYQAQVMANNKAQAQQLLQATDWVEMPSVTNPANTPHLTNQADFITYRTAVRAIAVNPPTTVVTTWPTLPAAQWST
jgi:hypothetical protein